MADVASGVDSDLLEEMQFVERVRALFKAVGVPIVFWEAYCLCQTNRAALSLELDRLSHSEGPARGPDISTDLLEGLRKLRSRGEPIIRKLHQFLIAPKSPADYERQQLVLGVLVGTAKGRESVGRWVNEPGRYAQEAGQRIQSIMERMEGVRQALWPATPGTEGLTPEAASEPASGKAVSPPDEIMVSAPGTPENLGASASAGGIALAWQPVPGASGYTLKRSERTGSSFRTIATPRECTYVDGQVTPGSVYFYVVTASNMGGESPDSSPAKVSLVLALTAAPGELTARVKNGRISLRWGAVPGASRYTVKRSDGGDAPFRAIGASEETTYTDENVTAGQVYSYAVSASNAGGEGPDSAATPGSLPAILATPAGLTAVPDNARVTLTWGAVKDATVYQVKRGPMPEGPWTLIATVPELSYVDSGVTNGTSYCYVITAAGPAGESPESSAARATPVAPPAAPTGLIISSGNARILLSWNAVPGPVAYNVKRGTAPGGPFETLAAGIRNTAQGDVPPSRGSKYYYVVSTIGPGGEGPDSAPVSKALPVPPAAPAGLGAVAANGRISLGWASTSGAQRYNVKRRTGTGKFATIATPAEPSYVDTAVTNGTTYEYVVSAVGIAGESPHTSVIRAEPLGRPPAPTGLAAQAGNGKVSLTWKPAPGAVEYSVERTAAKEGFFSEIARVRDATSYVDPKVTNGTTYDYVVVATNPGGSSPGSMRVRATPMTAPPAPKDLQGSAGQGRVLLTWAVSPGASQYTVKRATSADGPYAAVVTTGETTYTDTSVTDGTTYYYRVSASTAGGESEDAGPLPATPVDRPAAPAGLTAAPGERQITLSWQASAGAASYTLKRATSPHGPFTTIAAIQGTTHLDRDVDYRTSYSYSVTAMNAAGRSGASEVVTASPRPPA